jgi:iron complex outermembrane receptor protein
MVSSFALALAALSAPAFAQETQAEDQEGGIADIVVTAEKRASTVQETPVAISAYDQGALDRKGVVDVTSIQSQVPSLKFTVPQGVVQITLRGAGNDSVTTGADNGVGFHFDGVYLGNPAGSLTDAWDVERIEVLRGPQGTLYGRNTTGGAINIIPAKPTNEFMAKGDLSYGSYNAFRGRAALNVPLGEGVATRFAVTRSSHNGYLKNSNPAGRNGDDLDLWSVRGILTADLTSSLKVTLLGTYSQNDDNSASSPIRVDGRYPQGGPANLITTIYSTVPARSTNPRTTNKNLPEFTRLKFYGGSGTIEWDFGPASIRSSTSYYKTKRDTLSDWDDSPLSFISTRTGDDGHQFSQELTLISNKGGALDYILGTYLYNFDSKRNVFVDLGEIDGAAPGPFNGTTIFFQEADSQRIRSRAVYGQLTYHFSDALSLTGGLRYTWDHKSSFTTLHPPAIGLTIPPPSFTLSFPIDAKWEEPTGKIGIDYRLTRDNMLYASYSHGYKAGAINPEDPFVSSTKKELVDSWEIGSKNYFLDRKVQFNISAFYAKYRDVQINTFPVVSPVLVNIPGGTAKGVEVDFVIEPSRHFRIDGAVGYIDGSYKPFVTGNPAFPTGPDSLRQDNIGGNPLINTPKYTVALGAQYQVDAFGGELTFRGDFSYRSRINFDVFGNADMQQKGYTKTDLRISWAAPDERFTLQAFVQNLENDDVKASMLRPGGILGADVPLAWYAPPRTWGGSIGFKF